MPKYKDRLDEIKLAIDTKRVEFKKVAAKYPEDDGDGLLGAAKKERDMNQELFRYYREFYNIVVDIMEGYGK